MENLEIISIDVFVPCPPFFLCVLHFLPSSILQFLIQMISKSSALAQLQSQHSQIKLQMLQSNITRVLSQNKKLQHLLEYSDHFSKLKQHTAQVNLNRQRLNSLITQINDLDLQIKTDRDAINTSINHYYEHINKNIINQIKNHKLTVSGFEEKIQEIKNRQKLMVKKTFERIKQKYVHYAKVAEGKTAEIVSQAESNFVESFKNSIVPVLVDKLESQFEFNELNCRTEIGHLQNLLSFYNKPYERASKNPMECQEQEEYQQQIVLLRRKAEQVTRKSTEKMQQTVRQIDLKLKGISAEIAWLQNKRRRQKRMNTKQSQLQSNEQYSQNPKLFELGYDADALQYQIMGLSRYCDKISLRKKALSSRMPQKKAKDIVISEKQQKEILSINDRIIDFHAKIKQYDLFYKSYMC